jgi:hypothetical protein
MMLSDVDYGHWILAGGPRGGQKLRLPLPPGVGQLQGGVRRRRGRRAAEAARVPMHTHTVRTKVPCRAPCLSLVVTSKHCTDDDGTRPKRMVQQHQHQHQQRT